MADSFDLSMISPDLSCVTRSSSSSSCSSSKDKSRLPKCVSDWEEKHLEELHIYYHDEYIDALDVLNKLPKFGTLTEEQRVYSDKVKGYLQSINFNNAAMHILQYNPDIFKEVLNQIENQLQKEKDVFIRFKVKGLIRELNSLKSIKNSKIYEGSFTRIISAFAEMCCLHARISFYKEDQSIWRNIMGKQTVISQPDIRIYKDGISSDMSEDDSNSILVSVVKVKKDLWKDSTELLTATLESTRIDDSLESLPDQSGSGVKRINTHLTKKLLGQHGGELLLDLHELHRNKDTLNLTMPGMIINGTMVFFTLLEMSKSHLKKLTENEEIIQSDKGTIFCSRPYDVIYDVDRCTLIDIFVRLNNIEYT